MRVVFAGVLPEAVLSRRTKATWSGAYWRRHTREFAQRWDSAGVDDFVDPAALRSAWLGPEHDARAAMALQAAWLREQSR
jgi:asparagine synthase (glutamine-hydrolysing)